MAILFFMGVAALALFLIGGVGAATTVKALKCFMNTF